MIFRPFALDVEDHSDLSCSEMSSWPGTAVYGTDAPSNSGSCLRLRLRRSQTMAPAMSPIRRTTTSGTATSAASEPPVRCAVDTDGALDAALSGDGTVVLVALSDADVGLVTVEMLEELLRR